MKHKQMMALTLAVMMGTLTACSSGEKEPETAPAKTDGSGGIRRGRKSGGTGGRRWMGADWLSKRASGCQNYD